MVAVAYGVLGAAVDDEVGDVSRLVAVNLQTNCPFEFPLKGSCRVRFRFFKHDRKFTRLGVFGNVCVQEISTLVQLN